MTASLPQMYLVGHFGLFERVIAIVLGIRPRECSRRLVSASVSAVHWNQGQVNVMVLGLSSHPQSPSLDVGEDDADEFAEGCCIQDGHSFIAASLSVALKDSVSTNRVAATLTAFL